MEWTPWTEELGREYPTKYIPWIDINGDKLIDYCRLVDAPKFSFYEPRCLTSRWTEGEHSDADFGSEEWSGAPIPVFHPSEVQWVDSDGDGIREPCLRTSAAKDYSKADSPGSRQLVMPICLHPGTSQRTFDQIEQFGDPHDYNYRDAWVDIDGNTSIEHCATSLVSASGESRKVLEVRCGIDRDSDGIPQTIKRLLPRWKGIFGISPQLGSWMDVNGDGAFEYCVIFLDTSNQIRDSTERLGCFSPVGSPSDAWIIDTTLPDIGDLGTHSWVDLDDDGNPEFCFGKIAEISQGKRSGQLFCATNLTSPSPTWYEPVAIDDWGQTEGRTWVRPKPNAQVMLCRILGVSTRRPKQIFCGNNPSVQHDDAQNLNLLSTVDPIDWGRPIDRWLGDWDSDGTLDFCRSVGSRSGITSLIACTNNVLSSTPTHMLSKHVRWSTESAADSRMIHSDLSGDNEDSDGSRLKIKLLTTKSQPDDLRMILDRIPPRAVNLSSPDATWVSIESLMKDLKSLDFDTRNPQTREAVLRHSHRQLNSDYFLIPMIFPPCGETAPDDWIEYSARPIDHNTDLASAQAWQVYFQRSDRAEEPSLCPRGLILTGPEQLIDEIALSLPPDMIEGSSFVEQVHLEAGREIRSDCTSWIKADERFSFLDSASECNPHAPSVVVLDAGWPSSDQALKESFPEIHEWLDFYLADNLDNQDILRAARSHLRDHMKSASTSFVEIHPHSGMINDVVSPVIAAGIRNCPIRKVFIPIVHGGGAAREILEAIVESYLLVTWGENRRYTKKDLDFAYKNSHRLISSLPAVDPNEYHILTNSLVISAIHDIFGSERYGYGTAFMVTPWVVFGSRIKLIDRSESHAVILAAAGNDNLNVENSRVDMANFATGRRGVIAVENRARDGALQCDSSAVASDSMFPTFAIGEDGCVEKQSSCGTSFSAPRAAASLAVLEARTGTPQIPQKYYSDCIATSGKVSRMTTDLALKKCALGMPGL